jgi:hypothetical protein
MTDRAIVVHDPTTHPMESYWVKRKPLTAEEFEIAGFIGRIRERVAEDERRNVGDPHDQRGILGHDCYVCCALDRSVLLVTLDAARSTPAGPPVVEEEG